MRIKQMEYGLCVADDVPAEIEIYILGSPGQSGHCSLVIVLMAVDGGITSLPEVILNRPYGMTKCEDVPLLIRQSLEKIRKVFVGDCPFLSDGDIDTILLKWDVLYNE